MLHVSHLHSHPPHLQAGIGSIITSFSRTSRFSPNESWWQLALVELSIGIPDNGQNKMETLTVSCKTRFPIILPKSHSKSQRITSLPRGWRWSVSDTPSYHPHLSKTLTAARAEPGFSLGFVLFICLLVLFCFAFFSFAVISTKQKLKTKLFIFLVA